MEFWKRISWIQLPSMTRVSSVRVIHPRWPVRIRIGTLKLDTLKKVHWGRKRGSSSVRSDFLLRWILCDPNGYAQQARCHRNELFDLRSTQVVQTSETKVSGCTAKLYVPVFFLNKMIFTTAPGLSILIIYKLRVSSSVFILHSCGQQFPRKACEVAVRPLTRPITWHKRTHICACSSIHSHIGTHMHTGTQTDEHTKL